MDAHDVTSGLELRVRQSDWEQLVAHLFPGDGDEHGAVLLCGEVAAANRHKLLVREVVPASDGTDYVPGTRGYRHLSGSFVTHQLRRAKDLGLVYLAVHNHAGRGSVAFSKADLQSHERGYPTLLQVSGRAVGGVVVAQDALAGDVWLPNGSRANIAITIVIGNELRQFDDGHSMESLKSAVSVRSETHARQSLVFGEVGQSILNEMTVGVVGAGGVGMLIVQALSRLGVGRFVVIDPDVVSVSNLSRLPEATPADAGASRDRGSLRRLFRRLRPRGPRPKVDLATQVARGANANVAIEALRADVADDPIARRLRDCDFIFLAADTMLARDVVNQIAYQYLIPTLQVGSKVVLDPVERRVVDVYGVVRSLGTSPGCLRCNGLINVARLTEEALGSEEQRQNQRYVDDPEVEAPSVFTINAMSVGWAVNDFMQYATGIGRPPSGFRLLRSKPVGARGQQFTVQLPDVDPDCHVCGRGAHSALSRGDSWDLPTRLQS
jgi:tRNA A37 threonylcarbamoyladenosine dehydratase